MKFGESIATCLRQYFRFSGRAVRSEFWWFVLFVFLVDRMSAFLMGVLLSIGIEITLIAGLFGFFVLIPVVSAASRRLHDTGHSGWWQILPVFLLLLAIVGYELRTENINSIWPNLMIIIGGMGAVTMFGFVIVWLATPGAAGHNKYGDDPHGENLAEIFE